MISIIIPSYRYHRLIIDEVSQLVDFLNHQKINYELIVVDDGSINWEEAQEYSKNIGALFFRLNKNKGKGAAIQLGVQQSSGDYIIYTDSDIPFTFKTILSFIEELRRGSPLLIGDRNLHNSIYYNEISILRKLISKWFTFIIGRLIVKGYFDTQCGLKGMSAPIAKSLFSKMKTKRFAFDIEIILLALKKEIFIKKMVVNQRLPIHNKSTIVLWKHIPETFLDLCKIIWRR